MLQNQSKAFIAALLFLPWGALSHALSYEDFDLLETRETYDMDLLYAREWDDWESLFARGFHT